MPKPIATRKPQRIFSVAPQPSLSGVIALLDFFPFLLSNVYREIFYGGLGGQSTLAYFKSAYVI